MSDSDKPRPTPGSASGWTRVDAGWSEAETTETGAVKLGSLHPKAPASEGWVAPPAPSEAAPPPPPTADAPAPPSAPAATTPPPEPVAPRPLPTPAAAAPEPAPVTPVAAPAALQPAPAPIATAEPAPAPRAAPPEPQPHSDVRTRAADLGPPPPQFSSSRRSGPPIGRGLMIGGAAAVVLGITAALLFRPGLERDKPERARPAAEASANQQQAAAVGAAVEPYRPPDRDAVRLAYGRAAQVFQTEGASGLARFGQQCFRALETRATYRELDFCLAFDAYAAAITQRAAGGEPPAPDTYFGQTEARQTRIAEAVMAGQSDASARLIDIRRLAIEVARENGPAIRAAQAQPPAAPPAAAAPVPSTSAQGEPPAPASRVAPVPVQSAPARPAPRPAEQVAQAQAPARPRPAPPQPAEGPSAEEVAASRPAGRGPSFSCRSARTRSERLVCADPSLASLDRRLNAAYENAIAAGVSRPELRSEQDQWLAVREAAAPDVDAVADAYRRRIRELNDRR